MAAVCSCKDGEGKSGAERVIFLLLSTVIRMYVDDGDKVQIL